MINKSDEKQISISMSLSDWKIISESAPTKDETYTPRGITIYDAWQPIMTMIYQQESMEKETEGLEQIERKEGP